MDDAKKGGRSASVPPPKHFVDKQDLINEIVKSKLRFCSYKKDEYAHWDEVYNSLDLISNPEPGKIYRIMTNEHIPKERVKMQRGYKWKKMKTRFPPFKHYIYIDDNNYKEVLRSHWKSGQFFNDGKITDNLAKMILEITNRYIKKGNWSGYTFNEDMAGRGIVHLVEHGLKFDETKDFSPFAYFTTLLTNEFIKFIKKEQQLTEIKEELGAEDDLWSHERQGSHRFGDPEIAIAYDNWKRKESK